MIAAAISYRAAPRAGAGPSAREPAARAHRVGQAAERRHRRVPTEAPVGDAPAVHEGVATAHVLAALDQEALHHDTEDRGIALGDLLADVLGHARLPPPVLLAVAVARVDHEPRREPGVAQGLRHFLDARRAVVGTALATAQ